MHTCCIHIRCVYIYIFILVYNYHTCLPTHIRTTSLPIVPVVIGHTVNLAARLMAKAEKGQVLIDQKLIPDMSAEQRKALVSFRSLLVKGMTERITPYTFHPDIDDDFPFSIEHQDDQSGSCLMLRAQVAEKLLGVLESRFTRLNSMCPSDASDTTDSENSGRKQTLNTTYSYKEDSSTILLHSGHPTLSDALALLPDPDELLMTDYDDTTESVVRPSFVVVKGFCGTGRLCAIEYFKQHAKSFVIDLRQIELTVADYNHEYCVIRKIFWSCLPELLGIDQQRAKLVSLFLGVDGVKHLSVDDQVLILLEIDVILLDQGDFRGPTVREIRAMYKRLLVPEGESPPTQPPSSSTQKPPETEAQSSTTLHSCTDIKSARSNGCSMRSTGSTRKRVSFVEEFPGQIASFLTGLVDPQGPSAAEQATAEAEKHNWELTKPHAIIDYILKLLHTELKGREVCIVVMKAHLIDESSWHVLSLFREHKIDALVVLKLSEELLHTPEDARLKIFTSPYCVRGELEVRLEALNPTKEDTDVPTRRRSSVPTIVPQKFCYTYESSAFYNAIISEPSTVLVQMQLLTKREVHEALNHAIDYDSLPDRIVDDINKTCSGNLDWVRMIVDLIKREGLQPYLVDPNKWEDCFKHIILARMDKLSPETLVIIKHASALGDEFSIESLLRILNDDYKLILCESFLTLRDLGFIYCLETRPLVTYAFFNRAVREVIYSSIPPKECSRIHFDIAMNITRIYSNDLTPFYERYVYY